ncbi:S8 family peptidase, partial [Kaarinaea lacus]
MDKTATHSLIVSSISALFFLTGSTVTSAEPPADLVALTNTTYICGFNNNVLPNQASAAAEAAIQSVSGKGRHVYSTAFIGFSAHMSSKSATKLAEQNPNIDFCEANGLGQAGGKPAQAGAKGGKGGKPGQEVEQLLPWGVERVGGPLNGTGLNAWIIDSGIDTTHPDLNVVPERGGDFVTGKGKDTTDDGSGHGTHVAGILAAIDNEIDVVGVAAGANVIPVRVMQNSGWATIDDMIAGIDFVAENAESGDVANMSIWAWGHYRSLHNASLNLASRIPFIVIAGNDGEDVNERPSEPSHALDVNAGSNLYVVSSVDEGDGFSSFSNYGHASVLNDCDGNSQGDPYLCGSVNIAAPGRDIESLKPGGGLTTWWGTSMAAPH